jgi:hypothetical protein
MTSALAISVKTEAITTARLPADVRGKLLFLSKIKKMTMSEVIIKSLETYYDKEVNELDSYTLGLPYFGKYGSGIGDLSTTYKRRLREKLRERQNSY